MQKIPTCIEPPPALSSPGGLGGCRVRRGPTGRPCPPAPTLHLAHTACVGGCRDGAPPVGQPGTLRGTLHHVPAPALSPELSQATAGVTELLPLRYGPSPGPGSPSSPSCPLASARIRSFEARVQTSPKGVSVARERQLVLGGGGEEESPKQGCPNSPGKTL